MKKTADHRDRNGGGGSEAPKLQSRGAKPP